MKLFETALIISHAIMQMWFFLLLLWSILINIITVYIWIFLAMLKWGILIFFFPSVVGSPNCTPNSSVIFCVSMCYVNPDVFLCYYSFFNGFIIFVSFNNLQLLQHIFCLLSFLVLRERITFKQEHFVFRVRWSKDPSDLLCPQPSLVFGASRQ